MLSGVVHCIQTACDMIRNSIYRCYGIIPTIKEVFHLPSDLRLASQDTENDLMAMSFIVQREMLKCVCVYGGLVTRRTASGVFKKRPARRARPSPR